MIKKMLTIAFICLLLVGCGKNNNKLNKKEFSILKYAKTHASNADSVIFFELYNKMIQERECDWAKKNLPEFTGYEKEIIYAFESIGDAKTKTLGINIIWYEDFKNKHYKKISEKQVLENIEAEKTPNEIENAEKEINEKYASIKDIDYLIEYIENGKCTPAKNALSELFDRDDTSIITVVEYNAILSKIQRCKKVEFNNVINNS